MKILIADDSAIVRAILEQNLRKMDSALEIVASVSSGKKALQVAQNSQIDFAIIDSDMPEMNGFELANIFVSDLKISSIVLVGKSFDNEKSCESVAFSMQKPNVKDFNSIFFEKLMERIKTSAGFSVSSSDKFHGKAVSFENEKDAKESKNDDKIGEIKIVCIGASTGGPSAVSQVLSGLGKNFPLPIIYSQHIEIGADKKMAEWLDKICPNIHVKLADDGEEAVAGNVYMAPADKHLLIDYVKSNGNPVLKISNDPPERFLRPAVNKMFISAGRFYKNNCLAVLLTGMGRDGADGCKKIVDFGGHTIVEAKSTCVVFGMPAAAIEAGGANEILPRDEIPARILELVTS